MDFVDRIFGIWHEGASHALVSQSVFGLLVAIVMAAHVTTAWGVDCSTLHPSTSRQPPYGPMAGPERCEGFYDRTVSQSFVELVSLTRGAGLMGEKAAGTLSLQAAARAPLRLVVQPMPSSPFYRVEADLLAGQPLSWDPAPMLGATRLRASDLGFLALTRRTGAAGGPAAAPVALSASALAQPDAVATVRASVRIASLAWRSYRLGEGGPARWIDVPDAQRYPWQRLSIAIPMPADGKGFAVDVQAVDADSRQALPMLRFTVLGALDD